MPGPQTLKVDATAISNNLERNGPQRFLVIFNVNIPEHIVYGGGNGGGQDSYPAVLERVREFLKTEYSNVNEIYYQITATYYLVHKISGDTRLWTGSFFPKSSAVARLAPFQRFNEITFVNHVTQNTTRESVEAKLNWTDQDSNWQFDRLASVIINAQANVTPSHPVLTRRRLVTHGGRRRVHITFELP